MSRNVFTITYERPETDYTKAQRWESFLDLDQIVEWHPCMGIGACWPDCPGWHASAQGHGMIFPFATNLDRAIHDWKTRP